MQITKRQIDKVIKSIRFTPSHAGPVRIILDVGDMSYFIQRAQEYLVLAHSSPTKEQRNKYLTLAAQLTIIAIAYNEKE